MDCTEAMDKSEDMAEIKPLIAPSDAECQELNALNPEINNEKVSHEEPSKESGNVSSSTFHVDTSMIPCVPVEEQEEELKELGVCVYDQTELESGIIAQVDDTIKKEEENLRKKHAERELKNVLDDIRSAKQRLNQIEKALSMAPKDVEGISKEAKRQIEAIKREKENKLKQLIKLEAKHRVLNGCIEDNEVSIPEELNDEDQADESMYFLQQVFCKKEPNETNEEHLIRTGQMTPFGTVLPSSGKSQEQSRKPSIRLPDGELTEFEKYLLNEAENRQKKNLVKISKSPSKLPKTGTQKARNFLANTGEQPSTSDVTLKHVKPQSSTSKSFYLPAAQHKRKSKKKIPLGSKYAKGFKRKKRNPIYHLNENFRSDSELSEYENGDINDDDDYHHVLPSGSDEEYFPDYNEWEISHEEEGPLKKTKKLQKKVKTDEVSLDQNIDSKPWVEVKREAKNDSDISGKKTKKIMRRVKKVVDDGNQESYLKRLREYSKNCLKEKHEKIMESEDSVVDMDESFTEFDGGFRIPNKVWNRLYRYQQTGVRWLWELHQQNCGGIIGDEMGLGKTIQVIAFLAGLSCSKLHTDGDQFSGLGPVALVCPATVMHQWVKEFHAWWPPFRVAILHESGCYTGTKESLIRNINKCNGIIVTSFAGVSIYREILHNYEWHYIILDEGHKIRNPDAQVTLSCKQFRTPHRIILSGSPVQNNLKELWSLFDFVFPGKLGTLPVFMQQFSVPITQGGYANASKVQVQTAYRCAIVLRDTIKPYLLRRMKSDVKMSLQLPNKNEQVLFCKLTEEQTEVYKSYLSSPEIATIIDGRLKIFVGLINLRKICNHPDLFTGGPKIFANTDESSLSEDMRYGWFGRSGKMIVVEALLKLWKKQEHKVLLFSQSRQMLEILEIFLKKQGYTYMRMDGTTPISSRQPAVAKFNSDPDIFIFLLTTRVGGLGVNLTGANRVVIYDPDWNPSTDSQARERAWRIGQDRQVTVYRLLTSGTIEEKIYHRQIFKQFLTNRVLKDPKQRRFFKNNDLHELFTLGEMGTQGTETSAIFAGTGSEVKPVLKPKMKSSPSKFRSPVKKSISPNSTQGNVLNDCNLSVNGEGIAVDTKNVNFGSEKLKKMKELAKKLSEKLMKKDSNNSESNVLSTGSPKEEEENALLPENCIKNEQLSQDTREGIKRESKAIDNFGASKSVTDVSPSTSKEGDIKRKEKSHRKHKKRKRGIVVDGEQIDYLVKKDIFQQEENKDEEEEAKQDDYVLHKLFKKSGVHTALKHDTIMDSSDPDYILVEGEAERVAKEAIKVLKQSRRQCLRAETGIPTWTGLHGLSGAPPAVRQRFGQKKAARVPLEGASTSSPLQTVQKEASGSGAPSRFGNKKDSEAEENNKSALSSNDLLAVMRQRNQGILPQSADDNEDTNLDLTDPSAAMPTEYDELLTDIRNFVAFQASVDGEASTQELLSAFREKLPACHAPVFKALLSRICMFYRRNTGDGVWRLKPEFQ